MTHGVTIIIVTYNSERVLARCIDALPSGVRIIVLDNGSKDSTITIAQQYPTVEIVQNSNIGYGRAANKGLAMAKTPYVLLLNPDVVLENNALQLMVECAVRHPRIGVLGARIFCKKKGQRVYQNELTFNEEGLAYTRWISGASMLFNMEAIKIVGMFDERFFLFYEETDLCDRFAKAGYKMAVLESAGAEHTPGQSCGEALGVAKIRAWHSSWSRGYYYNKRYPKLRSFRKQLSKLMNALFDLTRSTMQGNKQKITTHWYEMLGTSAFLLGIEAYDKTGRARIT